jgi:flagellar protein FliO/FliZ
VRIFSHLTRCATLVCAPVTAAAAVEPVRSGHVLQVVTGLIIVLILIAVASWGARRLHTPRGPGQGHIRVIQGLSVGSREKLLLVEVGEQRVLIGMSPGRMQALASFAARDDAVSFADALAVNDAGRQL